MQEADDIFTIKTFGDDVLVQVEAEGSYFLSPYEARHMAIELLIYANCAERNEKRRLEKKEANDEQRIHHS